MLPIRTRSPPIASARPSRALDPPTRGSWLDRSREADIAVAGNPSRAAEDRGCCNPNEGEARRNIQRRKLGKPIPVRFDKKRQSGNEQKGTDRQCHDSFPIKQHAAIAPDSQTQSNSTRNRDRAADVGTCQQGGHGLQQNRQLVPGDGGARRNHVPQDL